MLLLLFENIPLLKELTPSWDVGTYKHVAPDGAKNILDRTETLTLEFQLWQLKSKNLA
jgi:hypothetical protein